MYLACLVPRLRHIWQLCLDSLRFPPCVPAFLVRGLQAPGANLGQGLYFLTQIGEPLSQICRWKEDVGIALLVHLEQTKFLKV